jgi:hypothetical protein
MAYNFAEISKPQTSLTVSGTDKITNTPIKTLGGISPSSTIKAESVNEPVGDIKTGNQISESPDISDSRTSYSGYDTMIKTLNNLMADYQAQIKSLQTGSGGGKSVIDNILGDNQQVNDYVQQYKDIQSKIYPTMETDISELKSLQDQYADLETKKEEELAAIEGRSVNNTILTGMLSNAEKNANIRLNNLATKINIKNSYIELMQGQTEKAISFVNKAIDNATAEKKWEYEQYQQYVNNNQSRIDNLSDDYKQLLLQGLSLAKSQYEEQKSDYQDIGKLMIENPAAGITFNDSLKSAYSKASKVSAGTTQSIYDDKLMDQLETGASPSQAAAKVVSSMKENLTEKEKQNIVNRAIELSKDILKIEPTEAEKLSAPASFSSEYALYDYLFGKK